MSPKKSPKNPKSVDKKPFIVLTRRAVAGWALAAFLLCGWMFGLGVWVGRGTVPLRFDTAHMQAEIILPQAEGPPDGKAGESDPGAARDSTELDFFEDLEKDRHDTRLPEDKPQEPAAEKAPEKMAAKVPPEAEKSPTEKPAAAPKSEKQTTPRETDKAKPVPADEGSYTIQVASVKNQADADRLVARLKKQGYPAYRTLGKVPGKGIWFRVRVGEYASRHDAGSVLAKLRQGGHKPMLMEK
jgi:cell division septation protein DedD